MESDSISREDVKAKKRKLREEEEEEDVEAEKRNNGSEEEEVDDVELKKRNNGREEGTSQEDVIEVEEKRNNLGKAEEKVSSMVLFPEAYLFMYDPKAYIAEFCKEEKEPAPKEIIPTLDHFRTPTLFRTRHLIPIREPGSKAVLSAAKFLLGVSSSVGGEPLKRCSGFLIDWDEGSQTGTVLTTANLIRTKDPPHSDVWIHGAHYDLKADITVHLLDGTSADGKLLYHQPHYDLAFLSVKVDPPVQLPSFNEGVQVPQKVFRLGRDDSSNLRITYGRVEYLNPDMYERYHNMYYKCADYDSDDDDDDDDDDDEHDDGGLVVDLDGEVVGMVNISRNLGSFIPSSLLLKCVASWKNQGRIPRPHLGMKFEAIKLLQPAHVDNIWRAYNIDDGLIVQEVSKGSHAEKIGIESGDIIESFCGRCVSTTVELENMLLSMSKGPLDSQNGGNNVHFSVGVFHARSKQRRTTQLTANVSDCGEVITKGP
uniref:Uncharacterized protein n=1 Tax=Avena sativa TaxID=4498 RepID=A0ACD5ZXR5_AVESA